MITAFDIVKQSFMCFKKKILRKQIMKIKIEFLSYVNERYVAWNQIVSDVTFNVQYIGIIYRIWLPQLFLQLFIAGETFK